MANNPEILLTDQEIIDAITEAEKLLIDGLGSGDRESIQEGSSQFEIYNRQLQLKKDIAWLEKQQTKVSNPNNPYGRTYTMYRKDFEVN